MDCCVQALQNFCKPTQCQSCTWKSTTQKPCHYKIFLCKTPTQKPSSKLLTHPRLCSTHQSIPHHANPQDTPSDHTTLLVESFHQHRMLNALREKLQKKGSCPLQILQEDGDWSKDRFWAVVRYLKLSSRSTDILQVL